MSRKPDRSTRGMRKISFAEWQKLSDVEKLTVGVIELPGLTSCVTLGVVADQRESCDEEDSSSS